MVKFSAGLLIYRLKEKAIEVFLIHPGGPFWKNKDTGAWSIPKGQYVTGEHPIDAAKREFMEETGFNVPDGQITELKPIKQPSGKIISVWAIEADFDHANLKSNLFPMEWPPKSGQIHQFPEADRGQWFEIKKAQNKILKGQIGFLSQLMDILTRRNQSP